ncbi:AAA family ATPase [Acinetobacter sp. CFCC 11171]|uniref:AAA family ATPase n=1 Tax=Acinetobacter sp. CFCC 11171 TaxID=1775558 RepID=UPI000DCFD076|nr:AAA family ATPase [Acinetobacter sp. CFCC 11171]
MKWKINRLEIRNFKAFEKIILNFDCSTLLTLEGPNGFGKTTIYDALELVFTGKIERINRLCNGIMLSAQRNYADNLFWNNKLREEDILIKIELINLDNNEVFVFSRKAFVDDLKVIQNNKANNFNIFKLFLMNSFDDNNYVNEISQGYLEEKLDDNFFDNYNVVNYLEQGQNQFIYSKSIKERKDSIKKLLNTDEISNVIKSCSDIERKITRKITVGKFKERKIDLLDKVKEIHMLDLNLDSEILYKKLSTSKETPLWDLENFNFFQNAAIVDEVDKIFLNLLEVFEDHGKLTININNKKIDNFIEKYSSNLKIITKIGKYIHEYEDLKLTHNYIVELQKAINYLSEDLIEIKKEMLDEVKNIISFDMDLFFKKNNIIIERRKTISLNSKEILEINVARQKLIDLHSHSSETKCLLCNSDFDNYDLLISALDLKTNIINSGNNEALKEIESLEEQQKIIINVEKEKIQKTIDNFNFNNDLFKELELNKGIFSSLNTIIYWLKNNQIDGGEYDFTNTSSVIEQRYNNLILSVNSLKKEVDTSSFDKCLSTFLKSFEKLDDVLLLNKTIIINKFNYYKIKKNEFNSGQIYKINTEILQIDKVINASSRLKSKINDLKSKLSNLENAYSKKIISEIELTFHIYSGRLIQNYQRGLGIFIDEGDGDRLRFCTAEQSAHDATLAMSSGQLSALSLAFFLSLNRVYANSPFILIDDPAQSLDDINIASLSDLLRCELKDRQLFLSSHEDDISAYLRFRFKRVGLSQKPFNIQKIHINS